MFFISVKVLSELEARLEWNHSKSIDLKLEQEPIQKELVDITMGGSQSP